MNQNCQPKLKIPKPENIPNSTWIYKGLDNQGYFDDIPTEFYWKVAHTKNASLEFQGKFLECGRLTLKNDKGIEEFFYPYMAACEEIVLLQYIKDATGKDFRLEENFPGERIYKCK
jgi:hypothetical protein